MNKQVHMQVPKAQLEQVMKARINLGEMSHSRCLHVHAAVGTCIHMCVHASTGV